ncbi:MAG TPA: FlgD immunoglobulin-like domain containing protein [Gaiellaceae bacterium]|nr:FlgD immunoglobulin-like domain containing protein [Gaiellaceae bacterium]
MTPRRTLLLALALAAAAPGGALAGEVRVVAREEPPAAGAGSARRAPVVFTMVGIHWRGAGDVRFRTARVRGAWSAWRAARPEDEDVPDPATAEGRAAGAWKVGNPWWTGEARWIQYRTSGRVTRLKTFFLASAPTAADARRVERASASDRLSAAAPAVEPVRPGIVRRSGWGADESIVRAPPFFAERVRFAVVHHTAGSNSYSAGQSAAIVRGIQRYHVLSNGWNDIGYNFLVDKYGRIFEGRGGGLGRNVVGAHAEGFNTGSVGVAVLGTYGSSGISKAARRALRRLLAWRLDVAHADPLALLDVTSLGNPRFPAGRTIRLRTVSGHRDTGYTSCPGTALYGRLGRIARNAQRTGLPKLYDPAVTGAVGENVRFTARLSSARAWTVEVRDAAGAIVAQGAGDGAAVDWTWDATAAPVGSYTYAIRAGDAVRAASGSVPSPPPLAVTSFDAVPRALTPNGDESGERTRVSFRLSRRATVTIRVENRSTGAVVRTLLASGTRSAGRVSRSWDGRNGSDALVADGRYRIRVTAQSGSEEVSRSLTVVVDRTLANASALPASVSPNGDGRSDVLRIGFELTRPATVEVDVRRSGKVLRTVLSGSLGAGVYTTVWDGRRANGKPAADGVVDARVRATTSLGTRSLRRAAVVDTTRPVVQVLELVNRDGVARLRLALSEPATLRVWFGRKRWDDGEHVVVSREAGTRTVRRRLRAHVVRVVAVDAARNRGAPVVFRAR